jgi:hypothetical protein
VKGGIARSGNKLKGKSIDRGTGKNQFRFLKYY